MLIKWEEFQAFCNEQTCGFVKTWKAKSIVGMLEYMPGIFADKERLFNYVDRCLTMEGFTKEGVTNITNYVFTMNYDFDENDQS